MMFASKTPRDLNHDPMPWVTYADDHRTDVRSAVWDMQSEGGIEYVRSYDPRPEFDHAQHNAPNPALIELRKNLAEAGPENAKSIIGIHLHSLNWAMEEHETGWQRLTPETVARINHARRVLTPLVRLANLTKETA